MKAAVFEKFGGPIRIQNVDEPVPAAHGVVIRVQATGLCRSDWHGWMGHDPDILLPHVPGHELAGVIETTGKEVRNFRKGDRVTVPFVCACGSCEQCSTGNQQVCDHQTQPGFTHWGSFAEYVAVDQADMNLVRLPDEMDDVTAATLGCRFITSFRAVVDQGKVQGGHMVAVHGCGGVGLSAVMIASALGAQVVAVDIHEDSLRLARDLGAAHTIHVPDCEDIPETIRAMTRGGAHVSLDALGSRETSFNSVACLRKRGRHVQVGLMTGDHRHSDVPMDRVVSDELEIVGSHGMQAHAYPRMLGMIRNGTLRPQQLIEKTISLEESTILLPRMDQFESSGILVIDRF